MICFEIRCLASKLKWVSVLAFKMIFLNANVLFAQQFIDITLQSHLNAAFNNNGIAVADYDNDNDLDIFLVTRWSGEGSSTSQLFRNENDGTFRDVTAESGINSTHDYGVTPIASPHPTGEKMGASWGDFNNDGYADLFLTNARFSELYLNNGDGTFTNIIEESGIMPESDCILNVGLWFDYNNDSYLDLYVSGVITETSCRGKLYRNNGDNTFTEVSEAVGLKDSGRSAWTAIPLDINEDGYQDIYIANDFGATNELFINNEGTYFEDAAVKYKVTDIFRDGMGVAYADFNNDSYYDIYVSNINESSLFQNQNNEIFKNVAKDLNVALTGWAWGCQFEDFDHDLDLDLVVANGYWSADYDRYYENTWETGLMTFLDRSEEAGIGKTTISNGIVTFDYDSDGDLDLIITRTGGQPGFFENQLITLDENSDKSWVQIDLVGIESNRDAIGTNVKLTAGKQTLSRYHHGSALMGQSLKPVHFGLSKADLIDQIVIKWPSGLEEVYTDLPTNSFFRITEGQGIELLNLKNNKIRGCTDPNSCSYNPSATFNDGSCEYLETGTIRGPVEAGVLSERVYYFSGKTGNKYNWEIENGHILSGQGSSSITVKWDVAQLGSVSAVKIGTCYGEKVVLNVNLSPDLAPENVSVARLWNEALLSAIRVDYARPTVHARNLFHTSVAMYDAWSIVNNMGETYLIGKQLHKYVNDFQGFETPLPKEEATKMAVSYAAYRLLSHRFKNSPNAIKTQQRFDDLMGMLGYDIYKTFSDYRGGDPAALGNFIGNSMIEYGLIDGANENGQYRNLHYKPVNDPLTPTLEGNPSIVDPNRWQPLQFDVFIDQAGNPTVGNVPSFLSPEWGDVKPFSLGSENQKKYSRDGNEYTVFHDPGSPPKINEGGMSESGIDIYKWNFSLVAIWSSHLDPSDGVMVDISPLSMGNININDLPTSLNNYDQFYDLLNGGDIGKGRSINPISGTPYTPQVVPRGDYTRVLAEFWADGPDSETPPGHWFTLLNYINDHPALERKYKGKGSVLDALEWDVKSYFTLGGAMHDAAITAWAIKGWYDYIRPISAIRYMADQGQSTDQSRSDYDENGIPLIEGFIEVVAEGDPLAGAQNEHVGKIKLYAWRGHDYIGNPAEDEAGVGWILAENWWPYQRPSFVTPPFAGYVSGHSTYSRAAAEVLTNLTGSAYFPGGIGELKAKRNEFLVFEEGPSQDVILQWATYRDASDQCSLSRIWGGIHPPADDIAGRMIGARVGADAFNLAEKYFTGQSVQSEVKSIAYPSPISGSTFFLTYTQLEDQFYAIDLKGQHIKIQRRNYNPITGISEMVMPDLQPGLYFIFSKDKFWKILKN